MPNLRMPAETCSIFNCYNSWAAPAISLFRTPKKNDHKNKLEEQHCLNYYSCVDGDLKRQIKNRTLHTSKLFLLAKTFQILPISQKLLERLPTRYLIHKK